MREPKLRYAPGCSPERSGLDGLPLAWDWRFEKINEKTVREFAEYIHWLIRCDHDQAQKDAVALLLELVEKARSEPE